MYHLKLESSHLQGGLIIFNLHSEGCIRKFQTYMETASTNAHSVRARLQISHWEAPEDRYI